jgi:hypothetical protein
MFNALCYQIGDVYFYVHGKDDCTEFDLPPPPHEGEKILKCYFPFGGGRGRCSQKNFAKLALKNGKVNTTSGKSCLIL